MSRYAFVTVLIPLGDNEKSIPRGMFDDLPGTAKMAADIVDFNDTDEEDARGTLQRCASSGVMAHLRALRKDNG